MSIYSQMLNNGGGSGCITASGVGDLVKNLWYYECRKVPSDYDQSFSTI